MSTASSAARLNIDEYVPMLVCRDVQGSIDFYVTKLGFEVIDRMDDVGLTGWASLKRGSCRIMLTSASYYKQPEPKPDGSLDSDVIHYFHCRDVVGLRQHLMDCGVEVSEFFVRFYGKKEIELLDPDGRTLIFGEDTDEVPTPE